MCLGISSTGDRRSWGVVTKATYEFKDTIKQFLCALKSLAHFPPELQFTSIQCGRNVQIPEPHTDSNNFSMSLTRAFGTFVGGRLLIEGRPQDSRAGCVLFDGTKPHAVEAYRGERYSIVLFSSSFWQDVDESQIQFLRDLGFHIDAAHFPLSRPLKAVANSPAHTAEGADISQALPMMPGSSSHAAQPDRSLSVASISDQLVTARRCSFRGCGQLPVWLWLTPLRGLGLVVDLFSGCAGTLLTLTALGVDFIAILAEADPLSREEIKANFPYAVRCEYSKQINGSCFEHVLRKRAFVRILVVAKPPLDLRHSGWREPHRIKQDLAQVTSLPILTLVECPAGDAMARAQLQSLYGDPIGIDSAIFGWVRRPRLYYASGPRGPIANLSRWSLPHGAICKEQVFGSDRFQCKGIAWEGKPRPSVVPWADGFKPQFNAEEVVTKEGRGALPEFTLECLQSAPSREGASREAFARAARDGHCCSPVHYEEYALLWKGSDYRVPSPMEKAVMLGIPDGVVQSIGKPYLVTKRDFAETTFSLQVFICMHWPSSSF